MQQNLNLNVVIFFFFNYNDFFFNLTKCILVCLKINYYIFNN